MKLVEKFKDYVQSNNLFQPKDHLLLAVSGGVDSVVLCHLCKVAGYDFSIAHCNFQLRGDHSNRDEKFVQQLASTYNVPFYLKTFDTNNIAQQHKKSIEEIARDLRYEWFHELINTQSAVANPQTHAPGHQSSVVGGRYILTAHHADDNIETVTMNFFRGTGIKGLRGILPKHGKIIRPLLFARRKELEEFVKENNLQNITDETNFSNDYTRNHFRNAILPLIEKNYPGAAENVLKNIQRLTDVEEIYRESIGHQLKKLLEHKTNEVHIPVLKLQKVKALTTIVYEIIKQYDFTAHQTDDVVNLLQSETGKYVQSSSHRIIRNRKWIIISPNKTKEADTILVEAADSQIDFAIGRIDLKELSVINYQLSVNNYIASMDAKEIVFPLLLRRWKTGDYFYPLGMTKKKKLSKFFIDNKLSLTQKENTWVIEMNKKIIWVVGQRIDDRFKITPATENVLQITLTSA